MTATVEAFVFASLSSLIASIVCHVSICFVLTFHKLAKKIRQDGLLTSESPVPLPYNGRVEVISSNSTLVIHELQYNDSPYQFSSRVEMLCYHFADLISKNEIFELKPVVRITVTGM